MTRAEGERRRIEHAISRLRTSIDALETTLRLGVLPGPDVAQPIVHTAADLACSLAKLWAFMLVEEDAAGRGVST